MELAIVKRIGRVAQTHPGHSAFAGPGSSTGSSKAKIAAGINSQDVISSRLNAWHPPPHPPPPLRQHLRHHVAVDVGEAEVAALGAVDELGVVEA